MQSLHSFLVNNHVRQVQDGLYLGPESDFSNPDKLVNMFIKLEDLSVSTSGERIYKIKEYTPECKLKGYYSITNITNTGFDLVVPNGYSSYDPIRDHKGFKILDITAEDIDAIQIAEDVYSKIQKHDYCELYTVKRDGTFKKDSL